MDNTVLSEITEEFVIRILYQCHLVILGDQAKYT